VKCCAKSHVTVEDFGEWRLYYWCRKVCDCCRLWNRADKYDIRKWPRSCIKSV